jgi:hypothetical protein
MPPLERPMLNGEDIPVSDIKVVKVRGNWLTASEISRWERKATNLRATPVQRSA